MFYGIKDKGNGSSKSETAPANKDALNGSESPLLAHDDGNENDQSALSSQSTQLDLPPAINSKNLLQKVRLRLGASQISEPEFLDVLKFSRIPEAQNLTALDQVPAKFLTMALEGWSTVAEIAHELRGRKTEGK